MQRIYAPLLAGAAALGSAAPTAAACSRLDLTFTERPLSGVITDVGFPERDSVADLMTWSNAVYDAENAALAGRDNGWCIRTVVGRAWECTWTLALADGQIMAAGTVLDDADFDLAVIGGTGAYLGAVGEMRYRPGAGPLGLTAMLYELRLCHG